VSAANDRFWTLYEQRARGPIERACEQTSRRLSGGCIDVDDMVSWIDTKVWRLMSQGAWPVFHEDPSAEEAVERVVAHVRTLSRWSYLALARSHFRRLQRQAEYAEVDRVERLAAVRAEPAAFERREDVRARLDALRSELGADLRAKIAASWIEPAERKRVAAAIDATRTEDDELIDRTLSGDVRRNTVEQMRSRTLRKSRELLAGSKKLLAVLMVVGAFALSGGDALAGEGEQTGGRGGKQGATPQLHAR